MASRDRDTFEELMKIQRNMNTAILKEMEEDRDIDVITLVSELTSENKPTQIEDILVEGQNRGYREPVILDVIEKLKRQNVIFQPSLGYLQKVK